MRACGMACGRCRSDDPVREDEGMKEPSDAHRPYSRGARRGASRTAAVPLGSAARARTHDGVRCMTDISVAARRRPLAEGSDVAVSIFVNPLQFENAADLARLPCRSRRRISRCSSVPDARSRGCRLREEMYPAGHATFIEVAGPSARIRGGGAAGTFPGCRDRGGKAVRPDAAGHRLVRREGLAAIAGHPPHDGRSSSSRGGQGGPDPARDADGLALSSRNRFLERGRTRRSAGAASRALPMSAADLRNGGAASARRSLAAMRRRCLVRAVSRSTTWHWWTESRLLFSTVFAPRVRGSSQRRRLGTVRLLDNIAAD